MITLSARVIVPSWSPDIDPATRTHPSGSGSSGPVKKAQIWVRLDDTPSSWRGGVVA
jgi:hypothetical protein